MRLYVRGKRTIQKEKKKGHGHTVPLKLFREWLVVQEDPRVVELVVEPFLHFAHHPQGAVDLPAVCQHEERRIFTVG